MSRMSDKHIEHHGTGPTIHLSFDLDVTLRASDLWPDGLPDTITEDTVRWLIDEDGGPARVITAWSLGQLACHIRIESL